MRFIGLDLAWSARNPSGGAVIEGAATHARLLHTELLGDDDEVLAFVREHSGDNPALVAVDAPLRVPNASGRRPAEAAIGQMFARYQAGAHPANRNRLARDGVVRGEVLVEKLLEQGFEHRAEVAAQQPVRQIIEVYTHPAIVAIFDLPRIIRYKARPKRSHEARLSEFRVYQERLRSLNEADPALLDSDKLLSVDVGGLIKARLKDYEDLLDGVMCAYTAQYLWRWGMERARVFGCLEQGYITSPVPRNHWQPSA